MKNVMDIEQVNVCLDRLKIYRNQEKLCFDDFSKVFGDIKFNYISKNSKKIDNLIFEIIKKNAVISKIHFNNSAILEKVAVNYQATLVLSQKIMGSILEKEVIHGRRVD